MKIRWEGVVVKTSKVLFFLEGALWLSATSFYVTDIKPIMNEVQIFLEPYFINLIEIQTPVIFLAQSLNQSLF